ncbi:IQ motif and SEC7 domain-containing protein 1 isoform X2 [Planococcus citri]|uniref:IQ motif and SEC7 domain-containing protein 1 isoform X2 n=1 Tax=Planococcus citri TaxID=170843 RepID=UPI0031F734BC
MNKNNDKDVSYDYYHQIDRRNITLEDSLNIINKQNQEIARLKSELNTVKTERDLLICENSKLKFELDIVDLRRMYSERSSEKIRQNYMNGSVGDGRDGNEECNEYDEEELNGDIDDLNEEDLNDNYKSAANFTEPYHYQWYNAHSNNNNIRNNSSEFVNHSRTVMSYELSQDLLEKQIEMIERKYGGAKARNAAVTIQRAFRRYMLIKKFTDITAMAKGEKRVSRRIENTSNSTHPHVEYCEPKNSSCVQANVTPIRSLSMKEKRLPELENGTNSLPRTYAGRCTSCNYCCANVSTTCSACCMNTPSPINVCNSSYCLKVPQNHSGSVEVSRTYQTLMSSCNSSSPVAFQYHTAYQKKYSNQYLYYNASQYHVPSSLSQMSTPKKVPPEVPKRTSSISFKSNDSNQSLLSNSDMSFGKTKHSGSMSSVQSSSSDSSSTMNASHSSSISMSNYSGSIGSWNKKPQVSEATRKRQYRVGLNLFNKKPEKGISYLMQNGFLDNTPQAVAKFLIARKGLSKQMIGEYLGNVQNQFNSAVLECFVNELDLSGMQIDVALRKYQTYFRMPGEAQKIERLMEVFSHRYCRCNRDVISKFRSLDTVFILAFAIVMLNTDLHKPCIKAEMKMTLDGFIKNLRGVDDGCDIDRDMLVGIYERIKANEFKPGNDHVSQVMKVHSTIVGIKMLALPHRRLVCYCRLYEVLDVNKKERTGLHQREVFLFNDLLVITKILSKKKNNVTYTFRKSLSLSGLQVSTFKTQHYQFGIQLSQRVDNEVLITFNARNDHDRTKFVEDIRESIMEMDAMENIRIELERQKAGRTNRCNTSNSSENRDSGVADIEVCQCLHAYPTMTPGQEEHSNGDQGAGMLKRSNLSNSLLDIHDQDDNRRKRSGSVGSLDLGIRWRSNPLLFIKFGRKKPRPRSAAGLKP